MVDAYAMVTSRIIEQLEKGVIPWRKCANDYYSVSFHEHVSRLNRDIGALTFGSQKYSIEELIAEIAAAMLMNEVGIEMPQTFENSVGYIQSWLTKLRDDKKMILSASGAAQKAADLILDREPSANAAQ